jgi:hypothetical protein
MIVHPSALKSSSLPVTFLAIFNYSVGTNVDFSTLNKNTEIMTLLFCHSGYRDRSQGCSGHQGARLEAEVLLEHAHARR